MRTIRDERMEAVARLGACERGWLQDLDDYNEAMGLIQMKCPHAQVVHDIWQYGVEYTCLDCGKHSTDPFGTLVYR